MNTHRTEEAAVLIENAVDSLRMGLRFHLHEEFETAQKHAVLNIFHSIELLLKARLAQVHPLLIYKNIDKPIKDSSYTVGFSDIRQRLANLGLEIDKDSLEVIGNLQKWRNEIEHYRYDDSKVSPSVIGKALKFVCGFLPQQLNISLENSLGVELFEDVEQVILDFEERLAEALIQVEKATESHTKDDLIDPKYVLPCPDCGNLTFAIDVERGDYCFFCRREPDCEKPRKCGRCHEYFSPVYITENMCESCESEVYSKF